MFVSVVRRPGHIQVADCSRVRRTARSASWRPNRLYLSRGFHLRSDRSRHGFALPRLGPVAVSVPTSRRCRPADPRKSRGFPRQLPVNSGRGAVRWPHCHRCRSCGACSVYWPGARLQPLKRGKRYDALAYPASVPVLGPQMPSDCRKKKFGPKWPGRLASDSEAF